MSIDKVDAERVERWFTRLYGDARGYLHVASTGNWAGRVFDLANGGLVEAVDYVRRLDEARPGGIYSRITTLTEPPGLNRRGGAALTASLPALWADVDIAGPGHKHVECPGGEACWHFATPHPNRVLPLPPDVYSAVAIVEDSALPLPSLWVHSGGGLYPIWLLDPTYHVQASSGLVEAARLSTDWQQVIAASARERGWHYGSGVGDLARVLRIPGTWNRKAALPEPMPCYVASGTMVRYRIRDLSLARHQARQKLSVPGPASQPVPRRPAGDRPAGDVRQGDDFTARVDWSDELLLGKLGWKCVAQSGRYREWLRPGAAGTLTATTGKGAGDNLWVFSTEAPPFPAQQAISKLEAFRLLHGHATYRDAVRALSAFGFGTPAFVGRERPPPSMPPLEPLEWPDGMSSVRPKRHGG